MMRGPMGRPNFEGGGGLTRDAGCVPTFHRSLTPAAKGVSDETHFDTAQPTTLLAGYVPRCSAEPGLKVRTAARR